MPVLLRPKQWGQKRPGPGTRINWGHPLARGLVFCMMSTEGGGMGGDLVYGYRGARNGSAQYSARNEGGFALASATSDFLSFSGIPDSLFLSNLGLSLLWSGIIDTGSAFRQFAGKHLTNGGTNNPFDFGANNAATPLAVCTRAGGSAVSSTGPAVSLGLPHTAIVTYADGSLNTTAGWYLDGIQTTVPGAASGSGVLGGASADIRVGRRADGATQMNGVTSAFVAWQRPLSYAEVKWLQVAPYAFLVQPRKYVHVPDGGAAPPAAKTYTLMPDYRNRSLPVLARSRRRP